jgi:hypothetical protein
VSGRRYSFFFINSLPKQKNQLRRAGLKHPYFTGKKMAGGPGRF